LAICKDCGARIRWAKTAAGRAMPLNEARVPSEEGTVRIVDGIAHVRRALEAAASGGPWYRAHWADCPGAEARRRRKVEAGPKVEEAPKVETKPAKQGELFKP
jgi:hypothetical protein